MNNIRYQLTYSQFGENSYIFRITSPAVRLVRGNDPSNDQYIVSYIPGRYNSHSNILTPIGLEIYNKLISFPGIVHCQFGYSFFIIHINYAHDEEHILQFIEDALNGDYSLYSINRLVTRKLQYSTLSYINTQKAVMHQRYLLTNLNKAVDIYNTLFIHNTTYKDLTRKGRKFCKIFMEHLFSSQYHDKILRLVATGYDIRIYLIDDFLSIDEYDRMRENLAGMCDM